MAAARGDSFAGGATAEGDPLLVTAAGATEGAEGEVDMMNKWSLLLGLKPNLVSQIW